ncbi:DNA-processing protein DprA [Paenibacillus donghaensis]|uniref:Smf/DprA SLOG domain-containing protein n=1 Tax=Paenibacillus donghaensis TaxID=414771 RepID=A0A2Z2KQ09_9BACL|nr:DNA-processing protein DprA [Paenibacillus donghaensis]ASA23432.1 hypothetical protein B9T62_23065 [Paenibacillus donghaensis]
MFDPNIGILTLLQLKGWGRSAVQFILDEFPNELNSLSAIQNAVNFAHNLNRRVAFSNVEDINVAFNIANRQLESCLKNDISVIGYNDKAFPIHLKSISKAPVILFVKGELNLLNQPSIAVIGTRDPSEYGVLCARRLGTLFSEAGFVVVSGLAKGIDAAGHWGTISARGNTLAVLAQGLNTPIYPAENRELAAKILEHHGALVSEYPPETKAGRNMFVERDRIQSGLSHGVAVVETDITGGTMHTVDFCIQQSRILGCFDHPNEFYNDKARGNKKLIQDGKALPLGSTLQLNEFLDKVRNRYNDELNRSGQQSSKNKKPYPDDEQISFF